MKNAPIEKQAALACLLVVLLGSNIATGCGAGLRDLCELDVALKRAYRQLLAEIDDPRARDRLIAEQREWRRVRYETTRTISQVWPKERLWLLYKVRFTRERIEVLQDRLKRLQRRLAPIVLFPPTTREHSHRGPRGAGPSRSSSSYCRSLAGCARSPGMI